MQQKIEMEKDVSTALYNEVAGNLEVLNRVDENAALDTPEAVAALRSVIEQLKVKTASIVLLNVEKTGIEASLTQTLSDTLSGIFFLHTIITIDNSTIIPEAEKPLFKKIRPQKYLSTIKENIEQIYNTLTISTDT
jgi:hypothetical protein